LPTITRFSPPEPKPGDDPRDMVYVRVGDVVIDQNVQRDVDPAKIEKMGAFDYTLAETPTLVEREDGLLVAVEGQHRVILKQTEDENARMWMTILGSEVDEPGIALSITRSRKKHSPYQEWNLSLARGEEMQVAADAVLKDLGLELSGWRGNADHRIRAVAAVRRVMLSEPTIEEGAELLRTVLSVLAFGFGDMDDAFSSNLIRAVAALIQRNPSLDTTRLTATLSKMTPRRWDAEKAHKRDGQTAVECIATAIAVEYNRGRHTQSRIAW
jgi:hypothetical protein